MVSSSRPRSVRVWLGGTLLVAAVVCVACAAPRQSTRAALPPAAEPASAPQVGIPAGAHTVRVGRSPEGIVVDPRTGLAVVAVRDPAQLVLLDARSGRVERRIAILGAPRHLQLARPGGPVLVPEEPVDRLLELSLPSGRSRSVPVGAHPHDAAAAGPYVFVSDEFGRAVSVIAGRRASGEIGGFLQPGGIAAVGAYVAIVDVRANTVTLIDARTRRVLSHLAAGAGPTHVLAGLGGRIYVVDTRGGAVLTYTTRPALRLIGRFVLPGGPYGLAIDRSRQRLWVTLTASNELVELSTAGEELRVLRTFATARQPNTVAVDPRTGRVLVAVAGAESVELIDPSR